MTIQRIIRGVVPVALLVYACSDPPFDPGAIPDDFTTSGAFGLEFAGWTTAEGNRITSRVTVTNTADTTLVFVLHGICPIDLRAFITVERQPPPHWNSSTALPPCPDTGAIHSLRARQSIELSRSWSRILGDSLAERRYFFSSVVVPSIAEGPGFRDSIVVIRTGNEIVTR